MICRKRIYEKGDLIMSQTKVIMNSGKEYTINMQREEVIDKISDKDKVPFNKIIRLDQVVFNPSHVSSLESMAKENNVYDDTDSLVYD